MLKRDPVKYIRDAAKQRYEKGDACEICDQEDNLDFHHFYSISELVKKYMKQHGVKAEDVLDWRNDFIELYHDELYIYTVTLCREHHLKLHTVYGQSPSLGTAMKQTRWVERQREKHVSENIGKVT